MRFFFGQTLRNNVKLGFFGKNFLFDKAISARNAIQKTPGRYKNPENFECLLNKTLCHHEKYSDL